jgi:hypothetical protein
MLACRKVVVSEKYYSEGKELQPNFVKILGKNLLLRG